MLSVTSIFLDPPLLLVQTRLIVILLSDELEPPGKPPELPAGEQPVKPAS